MTQPSAPTPFLARRIGPVPVWLIIGVLLLALFLWWRKRKSSETGDGSSLLPGTGVITDPNSGGYMYAYPPGSNVVSTLPPSGSQAPVPGTEPDPASTNTPTPPPAVTSLSYTIKSGDTLSKIGAMFGKPWQTIYSANAATIDATAKQHGKPGGGHWIFPGTTLVIPS